MSCSARRQQYHALFADLRLLRVRYWIGDDQNRFFGKIVEQKSLKPRTELQNLITFRSLVPIHREVAIDDAHPVIDDLVCLRKIVAARVFEHRTAATQFSKFSDEPRQSILIGSFIADGNIDFNADSWREVRQDAVSSIQRYSSTCDEIPHRRFPPSEVFCWAQRAAQLGICSS